MPKSETKNKIIQLLSEEPEGKRPADLAQILGISTQALHRHLKSLVETGVIVRLGAPPLVIYALSKESELVTLSKLTKEQQDYIEQNFSELRATGELTRGVRAFQLWLKRTKQEKAYVSLAESFISQRELANSFRDENGFIDLTKKIKSTLETCYLDKVLCQDMYSLPQFGKTLAGNLLTASKSGQNKNCFNELFLLFLPYLKKLIQINKIDTLVWTPHSIQRKLLIIEQIRQRSGLSIQEIQFFKIYSGGIPVAQKSLSRLSDRIENARETILLKDSQKGRFNNVLIIDDAIGSGATLNEIACKIKAKFKPKKIYGLAIAGSYKGFDVISVV
jgi:DNA-binding HxlR family transcriptional regulator